MHMSYRQTAIFMFGMDQHGKMLENLEDILDPVVILALPDLEVILALRDRKVILVIQDLEAILALPDQEVQL